jgi:hypothetical protein
LSKIIFEELMMKKLLFAFVAVALTFDISVAKGVSKKQHPLLLAARGPHYPSRKLNP